MENILNNLNPEQLEAVKTIKGSLLILAGAGSGKTRVLTSRIAYMIKSGVRARDILAVTFTNKAAKEMRARLSSILGEETVKYMWVGTFHSICGRILRQDIENYKFQSGRFLDRNFSIYDEQDSLAVIKQCIKKLNLDEKLYQPKLVKAVISNAKNKMEDAYNFATFARDFKTQRIAQIYEMYENTLTNNNSIDFDDMLMLAVKLLEQNSEVRERYYKKFKHILVDEFQDTNQAQYQLVRALYTNNLEEILPERSLCVVGDVDQSIYSWRGADFKIILNFQKDFKDTKIIKLEQNYRSTANILAAANAVIENNEERVDKVLYSQKGDGEKITLYEAEDETDEATYIASTIKRTSDDYNKFAVLYRTNAQSRAIEEAMIAAGIPYRIYGGLKFYDRKEIKDAVAYLKLIYNPDDSQSFKRIVNVPKRSIGDTTLKHLQDFADANQISLYQAVKRLNEIPAIKSGTATKLKDFVTLIDKFKEEQPNYQLYEFIGLVLERSGYIRELQSQNTPEDEARIENLQEFVNVANDFEPEDINNAFGEFLAQISLVSDLDGLDEVANNVTLMTLHSSKGLEFPIVFLAGMDEGIFPSQRTFNSASEIEEERRLMYVGVTRAEEKLYLLDAKRRQMWGEYKYYNPSRFLEEIPVKLLDVQQSSAGQLTRTFKSAVEKIKTGKSTFDSDGYVKPVSGFGSNFTAPGTKRIPDNTSKNKFSYPKRPQTSPARAILVKSQKNIEKSREKADKFFEDNAIKRMLEEKRKSEKAQEELTQRREQEISSGHVEYYFNEGERVFHEKLGIGHIIEVIQVGSSTMYTIDFGTNGKKAMDASFAKLKKF